MSNTDHPNVLEAPMPILPLMLAAMSHPPDRIAACRPAQIAVSSDGEDGAFNGMQQSGTLLILRNTGRRACTVPGLPEVRLLDAAGRIAPITRAVPVGMHPGPVVLPVTIRPGGMVSTPLHWIEGPVFSHNRCYDTTRVTVRIGDRVRSADLRAHVCGNADQGSATFDQPVLQQGYVKR